ncbi:hypothetical protein BC829DRAFT_128818 [Chytridium lagenaria]|nr:hypothetical protein BC829DRAFT_128818 [Chytridium lagenaria]
MATDRTDENLSSYVHYLLEGSGAEHHLDFSQLRRELDSNASSSLSFKVAHSTPIQQNSTKRNILSPEEYPQRKDSSVSRFGLLEDERSRKSYVSTAERSRKTQSSPEHETEAGLGRAILAKVTKRLMNLGFDALHPSLLGSKQGLTYEQSFMMATDVEPPHEFY